MKKPLKKPWEQVISCCAEEKIHDKIAETR